MASGVTEPPCSANGVAREEAEDSELHRAAFEGDLVRARELLVVGRVDPNAHDTHGNTPLHIAVMLGRSEIVTELISHGATVKEKNLLGWTPLDEAISYGDRNMIEGLLKKFRDQIVGGLVTRRQDLISALHNLDDFYAEMKWEFQTWVPLLSRLLPSDVCRIYKTGSCIRLDSTLGDFTEMRWSRGDVSFIFNGEDTRSSGTLSMSVLDNESKQFQRMRLIGSEDMDTDINEQIDFFMTKPIVYSNMSTRPITVSRAQSGWIFRVDKTERVGDYDTDVYNISNLNLILRKRREHLTPEQIQQHEIMSQKVERGELGENDLLEDEDGMPEERRVMPSLPPPPPCTVTWEEYIGAPSGSAPHLGRPMDRKVETKHFKAAVCISQSCPIDLTKLLDILEVITPYKHFHKLRQFVSLKLPPGFPVKLNIPVFPAVTAVVTLQKYEPRRSPISTFLIPREYKKHVPKEEEQSRTTSETN